MVKVLSAVLFSILWAASCAAQSSVAPLSLTAQETELLRLAARAPSPYNSQPWQIRAENGRWLLSLRPEALSPQTDQDSSQYVLAAGAFLENLRLAAGAAGLGLYYRVPAQSASDKTLVELYFDTAAPTGFDVSVLEDRRTLRENFSGKPLSEDDVRYLTAHRPAAFAYFTASSPQGLCLSSAAYSAYAAQLARGAAQDELSRWIRWSDKAAWLNRDGLTPDALEISGFGGWMARSFFNQKTVLKKSFGEDMLNTAKEQTQQGAGWFALVSADSSPAALIEAGRWLELLLLKSRSRNVALHPMSQAVEEAGFAQRLAECGVSGAQLLLRAGYVSPYPEPVTLRREPSQFAVQPQTEKH